MSDPVSTTFQLCDWLQTAATRDLRTERREAGVR